MFMVAISTSGMFLRTSSDSWPNWFTFALMSELLNGMMFSLCMVCKRIERVISVFGFEFASEIDISNWTTETQPPFPKDTHIQSVVVGLTVVVVEVRHQIQQ